MRERTPERQPMVAWFHPPELVRSAVRAVLASLFGSYADKREVQAAIPQSSFAHRRGVETWIDFVADVGDGFDPTYAVARLMREDALELRYAAGERHATKRGSLLVLGGDQVYPVASSDEYRRRFREPYEEARSGAPPAEGEELFAIPGNHDWYDGLTAFLRLFCQRRRIADRQTLQARSYWAIDLGARTWIFGIDVQLREYIDDPQLRYFDALARDAERMPPGSRVILVTARPSWIYAGSGRSGSSRGHDRIDFFVRQIVEKNRHRLVLTLTGDLHAYAHHVEQDPARHWLTWGGGGAALHSTHHLKSLELELRESRARLHLQHAYPSAARSRMLTLGCLLFPIKNPTFGLLIGIFYLSFAWFAQVAMPSGMESPITLFVRSPFLALGVGLLTFGLWAFADFDRLWTKLLAGLAHTALHLGLFLLAAAVFSEVNEALLGLSLHSDGEALLFGAEMLLVGGFFGSALVGLYLFVANLFGPHHDEPVLVCQRIPDHKGFVRLRLAADGRLTVYPIAMDTVPRWRKRFDRDHAPSQAEQSAELVRRAKLIEDPFAIS